MLSGKLYWLDLNECDPPLVLFAQHLYDEPGVRMARAEEHASGAWLQHLGSGGVWILAGRLG